MLSYHYNTVVKRESKTYTGLTSESAKRLLFKDFGGKKALKVFERKEKMKVNVDVVKDQLDKTLQGNIPKEYFMQYFNILLLFSIVESCLLFWFFFKLTMVFFLPITEISSQKADGEDKFDLSKIEQDQQLEEMVPKMNKEAAKIGDVYKIEDLLEPQVLNSLDADAVKLLKTPAKDLP